VPFPEVFALLQALSYTSGLLLIWSDCWYASRGFRRARWKLDACQHGHIWSPNAEAVSGWEVHVGWTKAHAVAQHVLNSSVEPVAV